MTDRLTDGQESTPWASSLLLTTQPCQLNSPHPSPAPPTPASTFPDTPFHLCCSTRACRVPRLILSSSAGAALPPHLPLNFLPVSRFLIVPLEENGRLPKQGPNPRLFFLLLRVLNDRGAIPLCLHPSLLRWVKARTQNPRLAATCCNFSSWRVTATR